MPQPCKCFSCYKRMTHQCYGYEFHAGNDSSTHFNSLSLSVPSSTLWSGLVDALRCLQWLLRLACLSVLDSHSLDSVGQELISRERHEHSHPSRGGHSRHLIPGHGCGLRVSKNHNLTDHTSFYLFLSFSLRPPSLVKKKVHPHSILLLFSSFTCLWCCSEPCYPKIIWFPVPCFSILASTCQTQKLILWLYSIPPFHHFFPHTFTRLLLMRKEFVAHESRAPTEPAWMVSSVLMLTLTAQLIADVLISWEHQHVLFISLVNLAGAHMALLSFLSC